MFAYLHLFSAAAIGVWILRRFLRDQLSWPEKIFGGLVVGWMLAAWAAYFVAGALGRLGYRSMAGLTIFFCLVAAVLWTLALRRRVVWSIGPRLRRQWPLLLFLGCIGALFSYTFLTQSFPLKRDGLHTGGAMFADMPFHLSMITAFAYGDNFPPLYRLFPPDALTYPFLPDFQAAVLIKLGLSLCAALVATGVPLAVALTGLFYCLARRVLGRESSAILATLLFLFGGGFGFLYFLDDWQKSALSFWQFLTHQPLNYAHEGKLALYWDNVVIGQIFPQRSSLYGMGLAFLVSILFAGVWRRGLEEKPAARWDGSRELLIAGFLVGMLPRVHSFTFIALGLLSVGFFLLRPRYAWLLFWIPALWLALPQVLDVNQHVAHRHFFYFQAGWMGNYEKSWPLFWLRNFGLPLLLIFPAWFAASRTWRMFYLPFGLLFGVCFFISISPDPYNNTKLLYYWYALTAILLAGWLHQLAWVHHQRLLAGALFVVMTATGFISYLHGAFASWLMFNRAEMAAAEFARKKTPPHAVFLAAPTFVQPVLTLAGRTTVLGFVPWLWSHGYTDAEIKPRLTEIKAVYEGSGKTAEILEKYGVSYIYFSPSERNDLSLAALPANWPFPEVFRSGDIRIYQVR